MNSKCTKAEDTLTTPKMFGTSPRYLENDVVFVFTLLTIHTGVSGENQSPRTALSLLQVNVNSADFPPVLSPTRFTPRILHYRIIIQLNPIKPSHSEPRE